MTVTEPVTSHAHETAIGLRQLADFLETHADRLDGAVFSAPLFIYQADPTKVASIPGGWKKEHSDYELRLTRRLSPSVRIEASFVRSSVCERVPTGNTVSRRVPTAWEDVEEPEYVWECQPLLGGAA